MDGYLKTNGEFPRGYDNLLSAYGTMCKQIHEHMVKLPFCKKYFSMLGVINFFSYYFTTLKKHRKMPLLPEMVVEPAGCPALFPSLPIFNIRDVKLKFKSAIIVRDFAIKHKDALVKVLSPEADQILENEIEEALAVEIWKEMHRNASSPMKLRMQQDNKRTMSICKEIVKQIDFLSSLKSQYENLKAEISYNNIQATRSKDLENIYKINPKNIVVLVDRNNSIANKLKCIENCCNHFSWNNTSFTIPEAFFLLPSEQSTEEIAYGKNIVGGCGMNTSPLGIQPFYGCETLLEHLSSLPQIPVCELTTMPAGNGNLANKGSFFKMAFTDMPLVPDQKSLEE